MGVGEAVAAAEAAEDPVGLVEGMAGTGRFRRQVEQPGQAGGGRGGGAAGRQIRAVHRNGGDPAEELRSQGLHDGLQRVPPVRGVLGDPLIPPVRGGQ